MTLKGGFIVSRGAQADLYQPPSVTLTNSALLCTSEKHLFSNGIYTRVPPGQLHRLPPSTQFETLGEVSGSYSVGQHRHSTLCEVDYLIHRGCKDLENSLKELNFLKNPYGRKGWQHLMTPDKIKGSFVACSIVKA